MSIFTKQITHIEPLANRSTIIMNIKQIVIGFAALVLGLTFYVIFRNKIYITTELNITHLNLFKNSSGYILRGFPSFIHVFSFSMITAGLIKYRKYGYILICFAWCLINLTFEIGQKYKELSINIIPDWLSNIPILDNTKNYFYNGSFDHADIIAIVVGTIMSFLILIKTKEDNTL